MNNQERLDDLLDIWEENVERGEPVSPEQLCADCPELLPLLMKKIQALRSIDDWMNATAAFTRTSVQSDPLDSVSFVSRFSGLSVHAKGGLGIVYVAEDQDLYRTVALKFLQSQCASDQPSRLQFSVEAEVTSRLEHPGIVPVYGLGETDDGRPFYAMRFIAGDTLDQAIEQFHNSPDARSRGESSLEFRALLNRFVSVCKTIAYAHNRGILHRDIKPANILLGKYGETLVVDWGLAMAIGRAGRFKKLEEKTLMLRGQVYPQDEGAGTPAYMSPEQVSGSESLKPAIDIYALGATLYKILTGRVPFDASSLVELRQKVVRGEFVPPSQIRPDSSKALQAICLKAMNRRARDRYGTAMQLAEDVERYLADEPVEAFREPPGRAFARWARRHRRAAQTMALALVLLLFTIVYSTWQASATRRATEARHSGLVTRASVTANAVGSELERRLLILEGTARDKQLIDALVLAKSEPARREYWQQINDWLIAQRQFWSDKRGLASFAWFINLNDGKGTQIARAPQFRNGEPYPSIGRAYARREYFHGRGPVPPSDPLGDIQPIAHPQLSTPFKGTHGQPLVAFTVPVRAVEATAAPLGVLGMAVEVFDVTSLGAQRGAELTIAHARPDFFDQKQTRVGLIMQHNRFGAGAEPYQPFWLPDRVLEAIDESEMRPFLDVNYIDPLGEQNDAYQGSWLAALAPIVIPNRDDPLRNPGWYVIIQERP